VKVRAGLAASSAVEADGSLRKRLGAKDSSTRREDGRTERSAACSEAWVKVGPGALAVKTIPGCEPSPWAIHPQTAGSSRCGGRVLRMC
jgi:hypothetical protein